jgi:hypothetical protein
VCARAQRQLGRGRPAAYPREWQQKKIAAAMARAEGFPLPDALEDFVFADPIAQEHAAIESYFDLTGSLYALRECEYYFRRYPFRGLPVSKHIYLRNMCEMYFNRFYEFREAVGPLREDTFRRPW